jgi:hypothetical protein
MNPLDIVLNKEKELCLTPEEKDDFNNFMVGYLCNEVSKETLQKALDGAKMYVDMRRK